MPRSPHALNCADLAPLRHPPSRRVTRRYEQTIALLKKGAIGSLYNGAGVKINLELQRVAVEESRLGIPLIFGADVWHGMHTVFPIPLGEAASWEPALANLTARATAIEATAAGIFWTYSPMVDVARDQRWGRVRGSPNRTPSPISPTYAQEAAYVVLYRYPSKKKKKKKGREAVGVTV